MVTLVPLPPRSTSATTPLDGSPGAACNAASAATESGTSAAGTPFGARLGFARNAPRSAPTVAGPQCAGTAIAMGAAAPTARAPAAASACHRLEGLDEHLLADMWRAIGGHQRHRVADTLDETAQHEALITYVRIRSIFAGHADFGLAVVEQGENRTADDRRAAESGRHQVRHPDRQPE